MYTSIRAELQKARRRHDLIVCLLVPVMALLWCQSAAPTGADELASAYSALFYSLPIINTILMPLAMAILASRLWDVEVKGCTPNCCIPCKAAAACLPQRQCWGWRRSF